MDGRSSAPHPHALSQRQTRLVTGSIFDSQVVFPLWLRSSAGKASPRRIAYVEHAATGESRSTYFFTT
jgi:hypothetical protein